MVVVFHHIGTPRHNTTNQKDAMMSERLKTCAGFSGGGRLRLLSVIESAPLDFVAVAVMSLSLSLTCTLLVVEVVASTSDAADPSLRLLTVEEDMTLYVTEAQPLLSGHLHLYNCVRFGKLK
jgi:hypothetical protein